MALISLKKIYKIYNVGGEEVRALDGIDLDIQENEKGEKWQRQVQIALI